jgi:hypothetical protein
MIAQDTNNDDCSLLFQKIVDGDYQSPLSEKLTVTPNVVGVVC